MTKANFVYLKLASIFTAFLGLVLFVCANTTSCGIIHQPKVPDQLKSYSKFDKQ